MKKEDLQLHDWFFKIVFSNPKSVKTLIDIFLPKLSKKIEIDSLKLVNTEKLSKRKKKFMLDLLYSFKIKNNDAFLRLVFEHKSYVDQNLPIQLKYYEAVLWEESLKENKKYPPIINIVLYHGKENWNIPTKLPENLDRTLEELTSNLNYTLIDLSKIDDGKLISYEEYCTVLSLLTMKYIFQNEENLDIIFKRLALYKDSECIYLILDYIVAVKEDTEKIERMLKETFGGEKEMMTLTGKWKMEGKMEGIKEGIKESLIDLIETKFGDKGSKFVDIINKVEEVDKLKQLLKVVALATNIEEVEEKIRELV
ncbi:Rpn family recombination-promoting nuclease/putative transposase [Sulfurihydrogenibium sp.]|jgi:predicted transposase/invertase (TIGR01784 family)|uniref:Rpn family recombination-promoting nuclease/putative transposase n=1 Tax=Sulfurihydrogenibium sp. TaxID=2053621 RepID=UPI002611DA9F|nr:Rpn family recombination-promoting nuclease/putative transposase [Sulfurihydrogenibium sp.]